MLVGIRVLTFVIDTKPTVFANGIRYLHWGGELNVFFCLMLFLVTTVNNTAPPPRPKEH